MKKIIYLASFLIGALMNTSCDSLDLSPEDYFGSGNFWNNEAQVNGEMIGLHSQLRGKYYTLYMLGETRGGTQREGVSSQNTSLDFSVLRKNILDKDHTGVGNWAGFYSNIMQVNLFINKVTDDCPFLSEKSRNHYLAQAHALRAYYYFTLYKTFGGVPLITEVKLLEGKVSADKFYDKRASAEETLDFVKKEINKSEELFADEKISNKARKTIWSKAATQMLKAEIYMWSAKVSVEGHQATGKTDLVVAEKALEPVMGEFSLMPDFGSIFSTAKRNNQEEIFVLHFADGEATNNAGSFLYQDQVFINQVYGLDGKQITTDTLKLKGTGGVFRNEYSYDFWKTYDETDSRRDATFLSYYTKEEMKPEQFGSVMIKGVGSINSNGNRVYDSDIIVYRYADALLMMAEIKNGLNKPCASYINEVRKRAYGENFAGHEYVDADFAANELAILHERDKEFVWECKRWYDVVRLQDASHNSLAFAKEGSYPAESPLITQKHLLLWPIDVNTLNGNPELTQTPGY